MPGAARRSPISATNAPARCPAGPLPAAAGGRRRSRPRKASTERETRPERPGTRPAAALRWEGGALPPCRACERGQSRAAPRALPGAPRRRTGPDRAEPVGRRPGRARPARPLRLPASAARSARSTTSSAGSPPATRNGVRSSSDAERSARGAACARRRLAERARHARHGRAGFAESLLHGARRARVRAARPGGSRRRARGPLRRLPPGARPARPSGIATSERRRAVERLQNDLDAWHGEPVFAYGFEDLTGAEWALLEALAGRTEVSVSLPVRAWTRRLRVARPHRDRPRGARGRKPRGARAALRRVRTSRACASRACALRRVAAAGARARRRRPLLRRRRRPRDARARRRRAARPDPQRDAARADRARCAVARDVGGRRSRRCSASLGVPYAIESRAAARLDAVRARAAAAPSLRVGGRRPSRAVRVPALSVLRPRAFVGRLRRGTASRSCDSHAVARRGRGREAARSADPAARRATRGSVSDRGGACARGRDDARGLRDRRAAGGGDVACRPPLVRRGPRAARRARRLGGARRRVASGRGARRARARRGAASAGGRGRAGRRPRPAASADTPVRGRVRPRPRGGLPAAAPARLAVPRRRRAPRARRPARASRSGQPRPLPLLHGLHARDPAPLPRA